MVLKTLAMVPQKFGQGFAPRNLVATLPEQVLESVVVPKQEASIAVPMNFGRVQSPKLLLKFARAKRGA